MQRLNDLGNSSLKALKKTKPRELFSDSKNTLQQKSRETAYKLYDMGLTIDKIAGAVDVSKETVQNWLSEQAVPAK